MTLRILPADPSLVEVALDLVIDMPAVAFVGQDDDELVGSGGLAWGHGRCWIWFKMLNIRPCYAVAIFRAAKRLLRKARQLGETEVFAIRDPQYETSQRLVRAVGFEFHSFEEGKEVYRCRVLN